MNLWSSLPPVLMYLAALEKAPSEEDRHEMEDNARTIRPNRSPANQPVPLAQPPASEIQPIVEDYSDLGTEEDEVRLQEKVADFKVRRIIFPAHIGADTKDNFHR